MQRNYHYFTHYAIQCCFKMKDLKENKPKNKQINRYVLLVHHYKKALQLVFISNSMTCCVQTSVKKATAISKTLWYSLLCTENLDR